MHTDQDNGSSTKNIIVFYKLCNGKERVSADEQRIWLEPTAQVVHDTEYGIFTYDNSHQKLPHNNYAEAGFQEVCLARQQPHQYICFQLCICVDQVDYDITPARLNVYKGNYQFKTDFSKDEFFVK